MNKNIVGHVENTTKLSRKAQLESYDGCARLRPVFDELASKYDAVITPSVVDEAPVGIANTGDAVSFAPFFLKGSVLTIRAELLFHVDNPPGSLPQRPWIRWRQWYANWSYNGWSSVFRSSYPSCREGDWRAFRV
jgi:hypothetical protein